MGVFFLIKVVINGVLYGIFGFFIIRLKFFLVRFSGLELVMVVIFVFFKLVIMCGFFGIC